MTIEGTVQVGRLIANHRDGDVIGSATLEVRRHVHVDVKLFAVFAHQVARDARVGADVVQDGADDGESLTVRCDDDTAAQFMWT